jgi:hypothetical protein
VKLVQSPGRLLHLRVVGNNGLDFFHIGHEGEVDERAAALLDAWRRWGFLRCFGKDHLEFEQGMGDFLFDP